MERERERPNRPRPRLWGMFSGPLRDPALATGLGGDVGVGYPGRTSLPEASSEVAFTASPLSSRHLPDPGSASLGAAVSG